MLNAPEAAGGDSACFLRNDLGDGCTIRTYTEVGGRSEGTHEASKKVGHCAGHEDDKDEDSKDFLVAKRRQIGEYVTA